ncbi:hypothetical protein Ade02nite_11650 [Paractinoplanes deccanensis]|uniref:Uncharacterized protein n=1 Tax=Paractinoplanes deccanensis TaxID=113561 RepID=A0ABQ3XXS8_9ACTN|nr:hypothetical protein Ade02nite_11650 [Actinoplanes deccanensis]
MGGAETVMAWVASDSATWDAAVPVAGADEAGVAGAGAGPVAGAGVLADGAV